MLFAEQATIHDVVEHQRRELTKALEALHSQDILGSGLNDLCASLEPRFRVDVPTLDRSRIVELPRQEVDIDIRHDRRLYIQARSQPSYLKGTALSIAVPFSGEAMLFRYGTSPFNTPIPGQVEGDRLVLTHQTLKPDLEAIKRDFNDRLNRIEETLRMTRQVADNWNRELPGIIRSGLEQRRAKLLRDQELTLGYPQAAPLTPRLAETSPFRNATGPEQYDIFLSHASEDKDDIARPLYEALTACNVTVWFDEAVLELGDSLRRKIDEGLRLCRFGLVILSPHFFEKQWPQRELDGLVARETASGEKAILPVWHRVERDNVLRYSASLADRVAARSSEGVAIVVEKVLQVLRK